MGLMDRGKKDRCIRQREGPNTWDSGLKEKKLGKEKAVRYGLMDQSMRDGGRMTKPMVTAD